MFTFVKSKSMNTTKRPLPKHIIKHRDSILKQLSEGLTRIRVDNDISQTDLSNFTGVAVNNISKYENGHNAPAMTYTLPWILDALGAEIVISVVQAKPPKIKPRNMIKVGRLAFENNDEVKAVKDAEKLSKSYLAGVTRTKKSTAVRAPKIK
jgi:transcriptional regulator with XRE-family HTH domain